jgi:alkylhydroperoxidase family enzyme
MTSATPDGPRIRPLPPAEWPGSMRDALAALRPPEPRHPLPRQGGDRPKGLNVLGTLARHPTLARAFHTFNGHVQYATTLSVRQRAVDELVRDATITDPTWEALASELDDQQLMDLVFTVGAYDLLAMAFRSFGVELDTDLV